MEQASKWYGPCQASYELYFRDSGSPMALQLPARGQEDPAAFALHIECFPNASMAWDGIFGGFGGRPAAFAADLP
jgi:hypothetical protein